MFGFFIAVAAGFITPQLQQSAAPAVAKALGPLNITEAEHDVLGFMIALFIAAIVAAIFGSGSVLGTAIGLMLGYFATRLIQIIQDATSGKPKS